MAISACIKMGSTFLIHEIHAKPTNYKKKVNANATEGQHAEDIDPFSGITPKNIHTWAHITPRTASALNPSIGAILVFIFYYSCSQVFHFALPPDHISFKVVLSRRVSMHFQKPSCR